MGKFTAIQTFDRFLRLLNAEGIDQHSLNFILDTGQLYTHGIFINGAAYGTEANNAIELTIAGTTKTLSLSSHTHSNYVEKNQNINIGTYKVVSGDNDLLYYSTNVYIGNTDVPLILLSSNPVLVARDSHTYTVLDTGNFSVTSTYPNGTIANGIYALIKYGSSSFPIEYVGRVNAFGSTFDTLSYLTSAGTTNLNNTLYGFITLRTDGTANNPSWAQIRINIPDRTFEYRTSASTNSWISLGTPQVPVNSVNVAGIVSAPTSSNANKVWKTDGEGNPNWRDEKSYTFYSIQFKNSENTLIDTYSPATSPNKVIKQGSNIGISASDNVITLSAINTWKAANTSLEGYVPKLTLASTNTIATLSTEYVLTYISGTETAPVWRKLPANAFSNTWVLYAAPTANSAGTAGYITPPAYADVNKFFRGDGTWQSLTSNVESALYVGASNGTSTTAQGTNGDVYLIFKEGSSYSRYKLVGSGRASVTSDSSGHITINSTGYSNFSAATTTSAGTAGLVPGPSANQLGSGGYYLRADGTWAVPNDANSWRNIYVNNTSSVGSGNNTKAINFVNGSNVTISYEAAGTSTGLSGNANYFNIKIAATDTTYETATSSVLGLVKVGTTITDTSGYTAVKIKDGVIYYKDSHYTTNLILGGSTATSNATSDTANNATYLNTVENGSKSGGIQIIGAGSTTVKANGGLLTITSTTVNNNTFSIKSKIGTNAAVTLSDFTANLNSNDDFTLILGSNITFTNDASNRTLTIAGTANTLYYLTLNGSTKGTASTTNLGTIWAPDSKGTGFLKCNDGTWSYDNTTYATPDATATLTTTKAITADTWIDTGLSNGTTGLTTSGTYAVQVTYSNDIYSGIMSWYAGTGGTAEEVILHYAGNRNPDDARLYLKTEGGKIYIAANAAVSSLTYTIKIRKLI